MADKRMIFTVFMTLLASLHVQLGCCVTIWINPNHCMETVDKMVDFGCRPDSANAKAKGIAMIQLIKGDKFVIAEVRRGGKATLAKGIPTDRVQVEGQINLDLAKSFLHLKLLNPTKNDAGAFSCKLYFIDEAGVLKEDLANYKFIVNKYDRKTLISNLKEKVRYLQSKGLNNSRQIQYLNNRVVYTSAFSATLTQAYYTLKGQTLTFPVVISRQGDAFDVKTGVYTAPVPGIYAFHLTLDGENKTGKEGVGGYYALKVNKNEVAKIFVREKITGDQSSVSAVVALQSGDKVYAVALDTQSNTFVMIQNTCTFSGFLMKPF